MSQRVSLRTVSTVEALVTDLRGRILDGLEEPGTPLREVELCSLYGVSRHSLRAAMQALVHEGLLQHESNRGVFIPSLTGNDAIDVYRIRVALETEAARAIIENNLSLQPIVDAVERLKALPADASWREVLEADLGFHEAIIECVGSMRMMRIFVSLQGQLLLYLKRLRPLFEDRTQRAAEHQALLDALASGDIDFVVSKIRAHLQEALDDILSAEDHASPSRPSESGA